MKPGIASLLLLLTVAFHPLAQSGTTNIATVQRAVARLVQTQIRDASAPGVPVESLTVYVLLLPGRPPEVFKTFDSQPMEDALGSLPRGSMLHYDGHPLMARPTAVQMQGMTAYCKGKSIEFILSPTN